MKTLKLFAAIYLMMIVAPMHAQKMTPMQLKEARMAAHQWVRDYNVYARMEGKRRPIQKFINLFEDESTLLFNDYLPAVPTYGNKISVKQYAHILASREPIYKMSFEIKNAEITSEHFDNNGNILFTIEFDKTISFQERGNVSNTLYAYPEKSYHATVLVKYYLNEEKAVAKEIISDILFDEILILHNENSETINQYTDHATLKQWCDNNESSLIKWSYKSTDFDPQIVYYYQDTIKNSIHIGGAIGGAFYSINMINNQFTELNTKGGLNYSFTLGYYRQLFLKDKNRLGVDLFVDFSQKNIRFLSSKYHNFYESIDPDGGQYLRYIDANNYQEEINRLSIGLPIALRYDHFVKDELSIYTKVGINISYDLMQRANATANVLYSGYYEWLFDVTITQNGIYDFGYYDIEGYTRSTGINNLGLGGFACIGIQYFIPNTKWSLDASFLYNCELYNKTTNVKNFNLTENNTDWRSASFLFGTFYGHNIQLLLNFNYNF